MKICDRECSTADRKLTTFCRKLPTADRKLATFCRKLPTADRKPATADRRLLTTLKRCFTPANPVMTTSDIVWHAENPVFTGEKITTAGGERCLTKRKAAQLPPKLSLLCVNRTAAIINVFPEPGGFLARGGWRVGRDCCPPHFRSCFYFGALPPPSGGQRRLSPAVAEL